MTFHCWIISLTVVAFQKFYSHSSHGWDVNKVGLWLRSFQARGVYRAEGNYVTVRTTWTEKVSSDKSCSDRLIHFTLKSAGGARLLVCCYLFRFSKREAWQSPSLVCRSEVPFSRGTYMSCTVAHHPESRVRLVPSSWRATQGEIAPGWAKKEGRLKKKFKFSPICQFRMGKRRKYWFKICGYQRLIRLADLLCHFEHDTGPRLFLWGHLTSVCVLCLYWKLQDTFACFR